MKANTFGKYFGITTFGESHGKAIGVVIEDVKPGIVFPLEDIQRELDARKPGITRFTSKRKEEDKIEILSGIFQGKTTGMPVCLVVYNHDMKPEDYDHLKDAFRPGHADYSYFKKFKIYDFRGGGRASGRETISRVAASGLVNDLLENIEITLYPVRIGKFSIKKIDANFQNELSWFDKDNYNELLEYLSEIREQGNSVGGIVEVIIQNVPAGLGDPVFEKLDANLAKAILSIGAVKGIEFGDGFELASKTGIETNDQMDKNGFLSNHSGGILGGISTGQNIVFRFVVKPTSSINIPQKTISHDDKEIVFQSNGRHDTCIIPRILPVAKAMIKLVLADALSYQKIISGKIQDLQDHREILDKIDEDILIALFRRSEISKLIGKFKKKNNLKIEDKKREKELMENLQMKAKSWKMDEDFVRNIWDLIIEESKKKQ
ncbi:MAG: chorismate synthase [Candidatus Cloacimonetes bacterium]|nr:chorismate synthase [Candidatus Cloacimonadota bacterium]